jgi:hypothetical protein
MSRLQEQLVLQFTVIGSAKPNEAETVGLLACAVVGPCLAKDSPALIS